MPMFDACTPDCGHACASRQLRPGPVVFTQREDFTSATVPFYEGRLHARHAAAAPRLEHGPGGGRHGSLAPAG